MAAVRLARKTLTKVTLALLQSVQYSVRAQSRLECLQGDRGWEGGRGADGANSMVARGYSQQGRVPWSKLAPCPLLRQSLDTLS